MWYWCLVFAMHMGMMIVCVNEAVCVCVFVLLLCLILMSHGHCLSLKGTENMNTVSPSSISLPCHFTISLFLAIYLALNISPLFLLPSLQHTNTSKSCWWLRTFNHLFSRCPPQVFCFNTKTVISGTSFWYFGPLKHYTLHHRFALIFIL